MTPALALTGERTLPGIPAENYWFRRHEAAYRWAAGVVGAGSEGFWILDGGCGEGYGARLLAAETGSRVVGVDYDPAVVAHAAAAYRETLPVRANLVALPFATGAFDAVVSLQTVEHLWDQPRFVRECLRVMRPDGLLVLSTPNRLTFSPEGTVNPCHSRELDATELAELVPSGSTGSCRLFGLRHGPRLTALDATYTTYGGLVGAQLAAPPEQWSPALARDVAAVDAEDFAITPGDLGSALDLLLVARSSP
jgi:SAM-dependent methyltransferase